MLNRRSWVYQDCTPRSYRDERNPPTKTGPKVTSEGPVRPVFFDQTLRGKRVALACRRRNVLFQDYDRFFILTGGPGSGKSSLIDALERLGYRRSVEAGRGIIQDQVDIGGRALPWADRVLFAE